MKQFQHGMSLIELMVSLVISTMILAGVMQVFVSSKHTYSTEEALSRMQENARFADKKISKDIRVTGFAGCSGTSSLAMTPSVVADPDTPANNFINGLSVVGFDSITTGSVDIDGDSISDISEVVSGTDVFSVNTAGACGAQVVEAMADRGGDVKVSDTDSCGWTSGEYLVITNCTAMDVFRLSSSPTTVSGNTIQLSHAATTNTQAKFSTKYDKDTMVFGFVNTTWFVKNNPETSRPALYQKVNADTPEMVVDGVENMQIRYGYDGDGDFIIDDMKTAASVSSVSQDAWKNIISIEISLLMASDKNLVPSPQDYNFWDDEEGAVKTHFASDNRIYYVFTRNVTMRNLSL